MPWSRQEIAARAARELKDGDYVNLGIGIPTLVANALPPGLDVTLHSENGMLGVGPYPTEDEVDPDLINAGKQTVSVLPTSSFFSSAASFAMVRGGHIDVTILGGLEVSETGDLANWAVPGQRVKGMGGAMDLVAGVACVIVTMEHVSKDGAAKIVRACSLPLTGVGVVGMVVTNLCVLARAAKDAPFRLSELAPGVTREEVAAKTDARIVMD